jgi:hypothetical protein
MNLETGLDVDAVSRVVWLDASGPWIGFADWMRDHTGAVDGDVDS